jgi:hyperosmotically inducible protein
MYQLRSQRLVSALALLGALSIAASSLFAQQADNTKVNTRDRAKGAVTADQQKDNVNDRHIAQKIRRALMQDKSLSSYAHNVKVIAMGGNVTLKGPVRSEQEKQTVEARAIEVAGAGHVSNHISVAPAKPAKK